jgi:dTDP-4-dehydrorhamnose reductase
MRTLVLGAKGQLGKDLVAVFRRAGQIEGFDLPELDISSALLVRALVHDFKPDLVLNAAAYTDVEGAEDDPEAAFAANERGARNVAEAASECGASVVYYSTDFIFDGIKGSPYEPDEAIAPLGVYAQSKAAGEVATREANARDYIIRTAWLYGPGGNNFVEKILYLAKSQPSLKVVEDEVGSPTHTEDLAAATAALVKTEQFGVYHAVNAGACSRYDFAREILRLAKIDTPIAPCRAAEFPSKAPRPRYSVLSSAKLEACCGYRMRPWVEALKRYMSRRTH